MPRELSLLTLWQLQTLEMLASASMTSSLYHTFLPSLQLILEKVETGPKTMTSLWICSMYLKIIQQIFTYFLDLALFSHNFHLMISCVRHQFINLSINTLPFRCNYFDFVFVEKTIDQAIRFKVESTKNQFLRRFFIRYWMIKEINIPEVWSPITNLKSLHIFFKILVWFSAVESNEWVQNHTWGLILLECVLNLETHLKIDVPPVFMSKNWRAFLSDFHNLFYIALCIIDF